MCGIAGVSNYDGQVLIEHMIAALYHRGPDSGGTYRDESRVHLGMRRLAIVGVQDGHQPMQSSCGRYVIVFNGEIFNSKHLRAELENKGYIFRTRGSDTESLLNAYIEWGRECTDRLNGMYAFVVYDKKERILFGARDFFGIKPLYFHCSNSGFAFASEIRSLLLVPWVSKTLKTKGVENYLRLQYLAPGETIFKEVKPLMPGESFTYTLSTRQLELRARKRLIERGQRQQNTFDTNELYKQLKGAIKRWSISEKPLGYSLSGGLDSGLIVALGQEICDFDAKTWTVQFENDREEADIATLLANKLGTEHTTIEISTTDIVGDIDRMVDAMEEPYGGGLPSWFVYKEASKSVRVLLTGTGGDELFGNYQKWKYLQKRKWSFWKAAIGTFLEAGSEKKNKAWCHLYPTKIRENELERIFNNGALETRKSDMLYKILKPKIFNNSKDYIAELDSKLQLPGEFLNMTDRFSMHWSLEARCPLLDLELARYVFSHSTEARTGRAGQKYKYQLRELAKTHLPHEYINAPKRGFGNKFNRIYKALPLEEISYLYSESFISKQGIFSVSGLKIMITEWEERDKDGYEKLWTLYMFQKWWSKNYDK